MASAAIASKLTATQLKGREKDAEVSEDAVELRPAAPQTALRRPVFQGERPLTAAQRGTALHMVMQYLNYGRTGSFGEIADEVTRLVEGRYITPQQGNAVNPADILAFFRSELGLRLRRSRRVEREFKFSLLVPAADYYPESEPGEEVLLQGVVDCWFLEEDGAATVVDFKTDRVAQDEADRRALDYRPQLDAYSRALSQAAGVSVKRRYLWFFSAGRSVEL
jgi:ATP-dependent helicase/nuclease subunit A